MEVKHGSTKGWIVLDQIRTVDRNRIIKTFDNLSIKEAIKVKTDTGKASIEKTKDGLLILKMSNKTNSPINWSIVFK